MAVVGNDDLRAILAGIGSLDPRLIVVGAMAVVAIADGALLLAADRRFRRGRLIADRRDLRRGRSPGCDRRPASHPSADASAAQLS
jgi:hypothetical protein